MTGGWGRSEAQPLAIGVPLAAFLRLGDGGEGFVRFRFATFGPLLRFENERSVAIQIEPTFCLGPVPVDDLHRLLEDAGVTVFVGLRRLWMGNPDQVVQLLEERLRVRDLRPARVLPAGDEV